MVLLVRPPKVTAWEGEGENDRGPGVAKTCHKRLMDPF